MKNELEDDVPCLSDRFLELARTGDEQYSQDVLHEYTSKYGTLPYVNVCFELMMPMMEHNESDELNSTLNCALSVFSELDEESVDELMKRYPLLDFLEWITTLEEPIFKTLFCRLSHKLAKRKAADIIDFLCHEAHIPYIMDCFEHVSIKCVTKVIIHMCQDGKADQTNFQKLIFDGANELSYTCVSQYISLQITYLDFDDDFFDVLDAIWNSGNKIARRQILNGIRRLCRKRMDDRIAAFVDHTWMTRFAQEAESPIAMNVSFIYSLLGDLSHYVDVMPYLDSDVLVRWLSESDTLAAHVQCSIAMLWRNIIDTNPEYIENLLSPLEDDESVLFLLFSGFGEKQYKSVEAIMDLLIKFFEKASAEQITAIPATVLMEVILDMIGTLKSSKIGDAVNCIMTMFEAFSQYNSGDEVKDAFATFEGYAILPSLLEESSPDVCAIITNVLTTMSEE